MKIKGLLILSILVVLSFGLLWANNSPGNNVPEPQDKTNAVRSAERQIDYATALRFIENLKQGVKFNLNTNARVKNKTTNGGFVTRTSVEKVLAQPGAVAVHYYFGQTDEQVPVLIIIGVDSTGIDMVTGTIMMAGPQLPCPPFCITPEDK